MKSFIAYPIEFETLLYPYLVNTNSSYNQPIDHSYKFGKLQNLEGIIVKCGVTREEGFFKIHRNKGNGR